MAEKLNFEQSLERLESISQQMEAGEVSLDQAVELYAEAAKLISFCPRIFVLITSLEVSV